MTPGERRSVFALAAVYLVRMLGLFLLLPVLAVYATGMSGATPTLVGLAMGIYGLTQATLQIPFGHWSDRFGRKPVIAAGLVLFVAGSVLGAVADTLLQLILARALQGGGAISAAVTALLADQTRELVRTRAMAVIGIGIGAAFIGSLALAPLLDAYIGVQGIFWIMAVLGLVALALVAWVVPVDSTPRLRPAAAAGRVRASNAILARLMPFHTGMFVLHFVLTATFLVVPVALVADFNVSAAQHARIYLGVFAASLALTVPLVLGAERARRPAPLLIVAALLLAGAQLLLAFEGERFHLLLAALVIFFGAVNFLEAQLPALVSRAAPAGHRGSALGVFATSQFLGTFAGGALGGVLLHHFGMPGVFAGSALLAGGWALIAWRIELPAVTDRHAGERSATVASSARHGS